ncbi:S-adenosyl-L-methionine-dependent methyltransferase [Lineolata rhizophorae]|uniref:S-adenosyl-L-methionine-dependent methyltransferase n=1 Tax=Lineolata rhizophorae TaxID=578093 RepID=A0A6A6NV72_9PEZI|nr:S-adenosyl-L-methionine-dependent methyltransferase [Lineolata rhizophorae]
MATPHQHGHGHGHGHKHEREHFDAEAADWDSKPGLKEASRDAMEAIMKYVPGMESEGKNKDVLEIGCGTGLLSYMLAPHVRTLLGLDTSAGMIAAFDAKRAAGTAAAPNVAALELELAAAADPALVAASRALLERAGAGADADAAAGTFDLVVSHLTMHHIPDMRALLALVHDGVLRPGGYVAVTDFEDTGPGAELFHPRDKRHLPERHGLVPGEMEALLREVGFDEVSVVRGAFEMVHEVEPEENGGKKTRGFPFVVCVGGKKAA